jgi:gliding motility-associated-like protein
LNASFPVTYLWEPPTGLSNAEISNPSASPDEDITYTLTVTSDKGCKNSDAVFVKVLKKPLIPNIFSPNGDGHHDRWEVPYLESYPGCTIDIVNRYGQPVYHAVGYSKPWDGKVNGKDVPVGTYYYVIDPKNGREKIAGYVDIIR